MSFYRQMTAEQKKEYDRKMLEKIKAIFISNLPILALSGIVLFLEKIGLMNRVPIGISGIMILIWGMMMFSSGHNYEIRKLRKRLMEVEQNAGSKH